MQQSTIPTIMPLSGIMGEARGGADTWYRVQLSMVMPILTTWLMESDVASRLGYARELGWSTTRLQGALGNI